MAENVIEILLYVSIAIYVASPVDGIPGNLDDFGVMLMGCSMYIKWQVKKIKAELGEELDDED